MFQMILDDPRCFTEQFVIANNLVPQKSTELQLVGIIANFQCNACYQVITMVGTIKSEKIGKNLKKMEKPCKTSKNGFFHSFLRKWYVMVLHCEACLRDPFV